MEYKEIAYQNKDITSKSPAENFKGKAFRVYGLERPENPTGKANQYPSSKSK